MTFNPKQIIFASTNACNLHCEHCFINRTPHKLNIADAIKLLESCKESTTGPAADAKKKSFPLIDRIGFSGGEPFLYMDFLLELTKTAVTHGLMFDQIITNGDWWKDDADLHEKLQTLYDAGYDGKFCLSWDKYHGQKPERMKSFINAVLEFFGEGSINIQTVDSELADTALAEVVETTAASLHIPIYYLPRTYTSDDPRAWNARHWFREDYCEGPGHILYVHADGNIAPCCGFANENPELFIGRITDSFETIMQNAMQNKMLKLCYERGLSHYRRDIKKALRSQGKKLPGKCSDICSFCDFVCKNFKP